jgi:xyloglucan-specific exo-beta-1,4-glucanase
MALQYLLILLLSFQPTSAVEYNSVGIGGGGYVTAILSTPITAVGNRTTFFRTDVGGSYRMENSSTGVITWVPLVDKFDFAARNYYGGDALALSHLNAAHVFMSAGCYSELDELPVGIFGSNNSGADWRLLSPPQWAVRGGSNVLPYRGNGERLAVHPTNENILLYGSYLDGLWRTADASSPSPTWVQIPCSAVPCQAMGEDYGIGALAILFDPTSAGGGDTVFASVPGSGMYVSLDAGASWELMPTSPTTGLVAAFAAAPLPSTATVLWVAAENGLWSGRSCGGEGGSSSNSSSNSSSSSSSSSSYCWEQLEDTPWGRNASFGGITINPHDPRDIIAYKASVQGQPSCGFLRSVDGGGAWEAVAHEYLWLHQLPWWPESFRSNNTLVDFCFGMGGGSTLAFASSVTSPNAQQQQLFVGSSFDVFLSANWGASSATQPPGGRGASASKGASVGPPPPPPAFQQQALGHEEVFVLSLAAPHAGPGLVTGTADLLGFVHYTTDLSSYPRNPFFGFSTQPVPYWGGEGVGVDYTEALSPPSSSHHQQPPYPVRLGVAHTQSVPNRPKGGQVLISDDGGHGWKFTQFNASAAGVAGQAPAGLAISAWDPDTLLVLVANEVPQVSEDGGGTWYAVPSLPPFPYFPFSGNRYNMSRPLAADKPLAAPPQGKQGGGAFYYAHCEAGTLYVSVGQQQQQQQQRQQRQRQGGGLTFVPLPPVFPPTPRCDLTPHPASDSGGLLWLGAGEGGLYFLNNQGSAPEAALTPFPAVTVAHAVAVGAPQQPGGEPVVYIFGLATVAAGSSTSSSPLSWRPFASMNRGAVWVDLGSTNGKGLGNWPSVMAASRQVFGQLVVGSFGRGAFYTNASAALLAQ